MPGPNTDKSGRIQPPKAANEQQQAPTLQGLLTSKGMMAQIKLALPTHINADRMMRIMLTALRATKNLAACDQLSFMGCVLQASQLGLEVNTQLGHCYLIPRRNGDTYECTMMIGYQGMIELALRSGKVTGIKTLIVKEGDLFEYEDGLTPILRFKQSGDPDRENKTITHAVGIAYIKGADPIFEVLSRAQIDARRARSDAFKAGRNTPWKSDYEAMARKTAVRALFKWIPKSPEMATAQHLEEANDRGERQAYDATVANAIDTMGYEMPAVQTGEELPVPDDVNPQTGETIGYQHPEGSNPTAS